MATIDHIGIAVRDLEAAVTTFTALAGGRPEPPVEVPEQGVRLCFLHSGQGKLELLEPVGGDGPLARFLDRRGEGLHHICYAVPDLEAELAQLKAAGVELVDQTPRRGHGGRVAFVHPRAAHGVLVELLQPDPRA